MNNHYNEIALGQIGKVMDSFISFSFEKHLWFGITLVLVFMYLFYKFARRRID